MSRQTPARRLVFALLVLAAGASSTAGAADGGAAPALTAPRSALFASGPHAARWARVLAGRFGAVELDLPAQAAAAPPSIAPARMQALAQVESLLLQARRQSATLHESEALASLSAAERTAAGLADVPGASAWMAEVQLQLGTVAAQAGLLDLAQAAFRRAATLEPGRQLLPAEAAPDVVALCTRIHTELAQAPAGEFLVRVLNPDARARIFIDDVELGAAPLRARAVVGWHLLRVEAPGHRQYGSFVDVLPGERPVLAVQLTVQPRLELALALQHAVRAGELAQVPPQLRAAGDDVELDRVLIVETAEARDRALLVQCDRGGCRGPTRATMERSGALSSQRLEPAELAAARAWLGHDPDHTRTDRPGKPLWKRWYVWGGAGLAVAAGVLAVALAAQPEPERRLRVVVDPREL